MNRSYLWSGVVLLLAAMAARMVAAGDWGTALVAMVGLLLILMSFAPEGSDHGKPR